MRPTLYIFRCFLDVFFAIVARPATIRLHLLGSFPHEQLVICVQEIRCLEVPRYEEDAACSPGDCDYAFDYVEPGEF